jgi:hypothetical protein
MLCRLTPLNLKYLESGTAHALPIAPPNTRFFSQSLVWFPHVNVKEKWCGNKPFESLQCFLHRTSSQNIQTNLLLFDVQADHVTWHLVHTQ